MILTRLFTCRYPSTLSQVGHAFTKHSKMRLTDILATVQSNSRSLFNFNADIDWRQRHEFLKCEWLRDSKSSNNLRCPVELPLNIHSPYATYETQFGHLQRPTHKNTTWDAAKVRVTTLEYPSVLNMVSL